MVIELWLIRHGETDWNRTQRIQGSVDVPLNKSGLEQAAHIAAAFHGVPIHKMFSSDLARARVTAEHIQQATGASLTLDRRLRERSFGQGEGLLRAEADIRFPNGIPDEERKEMVVKRAIDFLQFIVDSTPQGRVVCVSHGGFIRLLLAALGKTNLPVITNTSVTKLSFDKRWRVEAMGLTDHLDNLDANASIQLGQSG